MKTSKTETETKTKTMELDTEPQNCAVCLDPIDLTEGAKVCVLTSCKHAFHSTCLNKWLVSSRTCPVCRSNDVVCQHKSMVGHGPETMAAVIDTQQREIKSLRKQLVELKNAIAAHRMHGAHGHGGSAMADILAMGLLSGMLQSEAEGSGHRRAPRNLLGPRSLGDLFAEEMHLPSASPHGLHHRHMFGPRAPLGGFSSPSTRTTTSSTATSTATTTTTTTTRSSSSAAPESGNSGAAQEEFNREQPWLNDPNVHRRELARLYGPDYRFHMAMEASGAPYTTVIINGTIRRRVPT